LNGQLSSAEAEHEETSGFGAFRSVEEVVEKTKNVEFRAHLLDYTILPALTFASETWAIRKQVEHAISAPLRGIERTVLGVTRVWQVGEGLRSSKIRDAVARGRSSKMSETVRQLSEMHPTALTDVQSLPLEEIRKFLLRFAGVAECVALMSLGQHQCVPIDRHVFEITKTYFMPSLNGSKLTISLSRRLMEFYEVKFGAYAGWAQAVLFNQQLEKFVHSPLGTSEGKIKATRRAEALLRGFSHTIQAKPPSCALLKNEGRPL
uniref:ENDO3c domain-containing protein n=1 Tax=Heligmosomoides polygyrus TaxID=6339 RepID=A0A183GV72_HELPZ